ncbi:MAG TPA: carboxypeptidase-like regulatory domain-containing protein [Gemmatimonadaceae bacterium]|nr:carboxypeptidase-like regulatory domain-containing protein [Gemmatimonadaceae bacterium]
MRVGLLAGVCVALTQALVAQPPRDSAATLVGRILDATDTGAVANADVRIGGTNLIARSDGRGRFRLTGVPAGRREIEVRYFRYSPRKDTVLFVAGDSLRLDIYLKRLPQLLSELVVHGRAFRVPHGFESVYERGSRGWGTFITREQIDSVGPKDVKTLFEGIKGVVVGQDGVYFNRCYGNPVMWGEYAELWFDGQRVTNFETSQDPRDPRMMNAFLETLPPSEIQAIEVYTSSVNIPAEFTSGGSPCAVIAIWRKHGT